MGPARDGRRYYSVGASYAAGGRSSIDECAKAQLAPCGQPRPPMLGKFLGQE